MVAQQLSTASASAILERLTAALDPLDHEAVLRARPAKLARIGLSAPKIRTLKAIARAVDDGAIDLPGLVHMSAEDAHRALTALHGIGPWTADIYLLFCLGHADAWPAGDLALQEAARLLLGLKARPTAKEMGPLAEAWRPWRGAAACALWSTIGSPRNVKARRSSSRKRARRRPQQSKAKQRKTKPCKKRSAGDAMAAELNGPRLEPRAGGAARQLVVFLHGYGADGNDLIEIGRAWQGLLPQAAFVSPHAPEPCGQAPTGRQWFDLTFRDPNERWIGVNKAAPVLGTLSRRRACAPQPAGIGAGAGRLQPGHHDGAACGPAPRGCRRSRSWAIQVCWSCRPTSSREAFAAEIKSRPPVLLVHGDSDDLIPPQAMFQASSGLASLGVAGGMASFRRRRPRHRPGGPAPRRRVPQARVHRATGVTTRAR